jgi:hypothetical protein
MNQLRIVRHRTNEKEMQIKTITLLTNVTQKNRLDAVNFGHL